MSHGKNGCDSELCWRSWLVKLNIVSICNICDNNINIIWFTQRYTIFNRISCWSILLLQKLFCFVNLLTILIENNMFSILSSVTHVDDLSNARWNVLYDYGLRMWMNSYYQNQKHFSVQILSECVFLFVVDFCVSQVSWYLNEILVMNVAVVLSIPYRKQSSLFSPHTSANSINRKRMNEKWTKIFAELLNVKQNQFINENCQPLLYSIQRSFVLPFNQINILCFLKLDFTFCIQKTVPISLLVCDVFLHRIVHKVSIEWVLNHILLRYSKCFAYYLPDHHTKTTVSCSRFINLYSNYRFDSTKRKQ